MKQTKKEQAKWLSDLETLKKHLPKFKRDEEGFLIKDTKENAEGYMRVSIENSDRFVDMENKKIRKEKEKDEKEMKGRKKNFMYEDADIQKALSKSKKEVSRLGQGIHNGIFYNGTTLDYEGKLISAIITSNKKIYLGLNYIDWKCSNCDYSKQTIELNVEKAQPPKSCNCGVQKGSGYRGDKDFKIIKVHNPIRNEFGLNYRIEFNEDAVDYVWQTEAINNYLNNNYEKRKIKDIYEEILNINKKYIDHLNPTSHKYTSCWIIATYIYTLLEQFGRLYNPAEKGSGKTKQARVIKNLCFNPMWVTKGTESSIFRDAEATCGTFIVDNMDKLHEDLKRSMEHQIETGWMHDATYRLTNLDEGKTQKFRSYTPMSINNIYGLDSDTIDKTFEVPLLKSINNKIKRTKPTIKSEDWQKIRNDLRCWAFDNYKKVIKIYEEISASFSGREFDVVEGVLVISKLIGDEEYKEIEEYVKEKIAEELIDLENNNVYRIFSKIWLDFDNNPLMQETKVFLSDIADNLFSIFNPHLQQGTEEYNNRKKGFSKYIAKIIRTVPMFRKGGLSQGRTYIIIKKKDLKQYMILQHFINEDGTLLTSTTSTTSTKLLTSTNPKVDVVEQVDEVEQNMRVEESVQKVKIPVIKPKDALKFTHKEIKKSGLDPKLIKKTIKEIKEEEEK